MKKKSKITRKKYRIYLFSLKDERREHPRII